MTFEYIVIMYNFSFCRTVFHFYPILIYHVLDILRVFANIFPMSSAADVLNAGMGLHSPMVKASNEEL